MTAFLVGVALAGGFAVLFMVGICKLITAQPVDEMYADAARRMDELRCKTCGRVQVRGVAHGVGFCDADLQPLPPPFPTSRPVTVTYRKAGR